MQLNLWTLFTTFKYKHRYCLWVWHCKQTYEIKIENLKSSRKYNLDDPPLHIRCLAIHHLTVSLFLSFKGHQFWTTCIQKLFGCWDKSYCTWGLCYCSEAPKSQDKAGMWCWPGLRSYKIINSQFCMKQESCFFCLNGAKEVSITYSFLVCTHHQ